ncbi:MAG: lipopolysaccharide biosynthesis protein [Herpetosiphonaceae bacterium]|nr:lipopolysaccharide biosynthesis protein [Herpetosiphonaceae bacterium]
MRLQDYLTVLRKRWWLIGLVGLSAALVALGISRLQRPTYRAQASYIISINRVDSGGYSFIANALNLFIRQVHNPDKFEQISQDLRLDVPAETLLANVRMQPQPIESTITIEADSPNTTDPPRIINAIGDALVAKVAEKNRLSDGQDRYQIDRESPTPVFKAKPQTKINTLAGGVLGLILGTLLAFVLEYLDDTLKTPGDVERFVGLPTLSQIPAGTAQRSVRRPRRPVAVTAGIVERKEPYAKRQ